jgi:hypothetical protein
MHKEPYKTSRPDLSTPAGSAPHTTYGSDFSCAHSQPAFTAALDQFEGLDHDAVNRHNAGLLFPGVT